MAKKTYHGSDIDITFDLDTCIHAAECVRGLPKVFDTGRKPWILPDEASAAELRDVVARCPSGALEAVEKSHGAPTPEPVRIQAMEGGPFVIAGGVRLLDQEGNVLREGTKMALCRCGRSAKRPFCDGSHAS